MTTLASSRDWASEFEIDPDVVFLNHAAFGPVTKRGRLAIESLMARWGRFEEGLDVDDESYRLLIDVREAFARLISGDHKRVAYVPNTSHGLNTVLWGMNLQKGERLLITDVEFPSVVYAVQNIVRQRGLKLDIMHCPNGSFSADELEAALERRPAAFVFSWVQYFNGYRYDQKSIADMCHDIGCFVLVDGMQGVGAVPLDVESTGIDALACGGQKWLFSQTGSGFLYIKPDPVRDVTPPFAGWMGVDWNYTFHDLRHTDKAPYDDGRRWEVGTYPYCALRFAATGLELIKECGKAEIWTRIQHLHRYMTAGLEGTQYEAEVFPEQRTSGIMYLRGPKVQLLHQYLAKRRIYTSFREGGLRVSPHFYNTEHDIEILLQAIREFERT